MTGRKSPKIIYFIVCFLLIFEQSGFAQVAAQLDIASHLSAMHNALTVDKFRPLHLRYISYDSLNNNFKLLLDKGDTKNPKTQEIESTAKDLLNYFFVGISLPHDAFWVNLRPDSPNDIIDPLLAQTEVGRILLESDLQLKKDTAKATSPETPEGREYWNNLYQKAEELYGSQNVTIPTLTRPWIVPDEIIIRESTDSAYVYKATLKIMLEQDYLKGNATYSFKDPREKELNEYSSQIIRENILPKLIKDINNAKRYAPLRQVYYSLILAQWFKARNANKNTQYSRLIDRKDLSNLQSKTSYSIATYFNAYRDNFEKGEYNIKEPAYTPYGQVIRSYFSGGITNVAPVVPGLGQPTHVNPTGTRVTVAPVVNDPSANRNTLPLMRATREPNGDVTITEPARQQVEETGISRRGFLKMLGLVGLGIVVLGPESVMGQSASSGRQKVYLLFHKHMIDVTAYYNVLTDFDIAMASYYAKMDRDIKTKHGAIEGEKRLLEIRRLTSEEYAQAIKDELNQLSRYRMSVSEIWTENSSLIKEHRKEVEAIKKAISEQGVVAVGTEWTPEELEKQKNKAKEYRDAIITYFRAADVNGYSQKADDLFLILVGPELYLFATGYAPFVNGEVKLIGLESSEIKQNGYKLIDVADKADRKLLDMRPDIAEQWYAFKLKINNNGRLLSDYEIGEELNVLFGSNKVGRKEAESVVNLLLEFYRNSEERDRYVVQQLVASGMGKILVVRGEEHKPAIQKAVEGLNKERKFEVEEVRPARVSGRLHGLFAHRADGTTVIYVNRNEIDAYLDDFAQVLGKEHPTREEVLSYLDGHETFHALINKLRSEGNALSEIDEAEEERLAEIFGKVFALDIGNVDADLIDEIQAIERVLGVTLMDTLRQRPQNLEVLLSALGISVKIKVATPQEMEEVKNQVRRKSGLAMEARPGSQVEAGAGRNRVSGVGRLWIEQQGEIPSIKGEDAKAKAETWIRGYDGWVYYPAALDDTGSLLDLVRLFPKAKFALSDGFLPGGALWVDQMPDKNNLEEVAKFLQTRFMTSRLPSRQFPIERIDTKIDARQKRIHFIFHLKDTLGTPWEGLRVKEIEFDYFVGLFEEIPIKVGVIFVQNPGLAWKEFRKAEFWDIMADQLIPGGFILFDWEHSNAFDIPSMRFETILDFEQAIRYRNDTRGGLILSQKESPDQPTPTATHTVSFPSPAKTDGIDDSATDPSLRSESMPQAPKNTGGIDFRFLPIVTQSMDNLKASIRAMPQASLQRINLTQEWSDIERLVNSGITPSAERIKDYLAASCFKGNLDTDIDKIVSCISDILRMQEETCCLTDPTLKDILVVLGSGRSGAELNQVFLGKVI